MRAFDVCIVPHQVTPFTESLNPLKLFEYLAAGLPVVSTDVAGFRDFADRGVAGAEGKFVYLARGERGSEREAAFLKGCELALLERRSPESFRLLSAARQQEAAGSSWKARVDAILDVIDGDVLGSAGSMVAQRTSATAS
jgi:glycosyltransferase involved in cell wall biosynthesis